MLVIRAIPDVRLVSLALGVVFSILGDLFPAISLLRDDKRDRQIPGVFLLLLAPLPVLNQILSITNAANPLQGVMASEHAVACLIELIDLVFHAHRTVMHWDVILVHQFVYEYLALLLFDILLPYAEHIDTATLVVRAGESQLIVPIALTIVEGHQASFLEHMVLSNRLNDLSV